MEHKIEVLSCESNQAGQTVRPYAVDGEVIYKMNMNNLLRDEAEQEYNEVDGLCKAIENVTGVCIPRDQLPKILKDKVFYGDS